MVQKNFLFVTFCLVLVIGLLQTYGFMKDYLSPTKYLETQWARAERKNEVEKLKIALLENQIDDLKTEIAAAIPEATKSGVLSGDSSNLQLRGLASIARTKVGALELSGVLDQKAKALFREKKYVEANSVFKELIEKYPSSPRVVEAYFFQAEGFFLTGQYQQSLDVIDHMIQHFPDSELTGFIMLRMGQILASRNRADEAKEVYKVILQVHGNNPDIKDQAEKLLKTAEL